MNTRGRMSLVAAPRRKPLPHQRERIEPVLFARNPVPKRFPSVAVSLIACVWAVDAANAENVMEALDELEIGVSHPDVERFA
jgi:hypothetical protein